MGYIHITKLRDQGYLLYEILEREFTGSVTGTELNTVFGRKGPWAHGMIAEHLHALDSPDLFIQDAPDRSTIPEKMTSCDSVFDDNKNDSRSRFLT
jgi:hypothetical protein